MMISWQVLTFRRLLAQAISLVFCGLVIARSGAATYTWIGGGTTNNWADSTNWTFFSGPPTSGGNDVIIDDDTNSPGSTVFSDLQTFGNSDLDYSIDSLTFASGMVVNVDIRGGRLGVHEIINDDAGTHEFANEAVDITGLTGFDTNAVRANSGDIFFSAPVHFTAQNQTLITSGDFDITFGGGITRAGFITQIPTLNHFGDGTVLLRDDVTALGAITISFDGIVALSSSVPPTLASNVTINTGATGSFDMNGVDTDIGQLLGSGIVTTNGGTITTGTSGNFTFSGSIQNGGGGVGGNLVKNSSGAMTLDGDNTYTGTTSIDNGTLRLGSSNRLSNSTDVTVNSGGTFDVNGFSETVDSVSGSGSITLGGGTLIVDESSGSRTFSGNISESGTFTKTGGGTLALAGNNSMSTLEINGGILQVNNAGVLGNGTVVIGNATLQNTAPLTSNRPITLNSSGSTINVNSAATFTQNGAIGGTGALNKIGNGALQLGTSNTYTGDTNIKDGILRLSGSNVISNSSDLTLVTGATLQMNGFTETVRSLSGTGGLVMPSGGTLTVNASSGTFTYAGGMSGSGNLNKQGGHTLVITNPLNFAGAMNITGGTLQFSGSGSLSSSTDVAINSAAWDLNGVSDTVDSISGSGSITLGSATLTVDEDSAATRTFSGTISGTGGFGKNGTHTLVLSGNNSFSGELSLSDGTLSVATSSHLGAASSTLVFFGGTLETTGSFTDARSVVIGPFTSATFDTNSSTTLIQSGAVTGASTTTVNKTGGGTLRFTAANAASFDGDIIVSEGIFDMAGGGNALGNSTTVTVNSPATFLVNNPDDIGGLAGNGSVVLNQALNPGFDNASTTFSGVISGTAQLGKRGMGTLTLSGNNTYTGPTDINDGVLRLSGNGRLSNSTDVDVASGATFDLNGVTDAIDALSGAGSVTLGGGALTVGANNGSSTFSGDISESGSFIKAGAGTQTLSGNNTWDEGTQINGGVLRVASTFSNLGVGSIELDGGTLETTATHNNFKGVVLNSGGGTLDVDAGTTLTMAAGTPITGVGSLTKADTGTLVLTANNTFTGDTLITSGMLQYSGGIARLSDLTDVVLSPGAVWDLNGTSDTVKSISGSGGSIRLDGATLTVNQDGGSTEYRGEISELGGLTKSGTHSLRLSGLNSYGGPTAINEGVLEITEDSNLGAPGSDLVFDGGTLYLLPSTPMAFDPGRLITLDIGGGTIFLEAGSSLAIPGVISGPGKLNIESDNEETLVLSGVNTYQGGTSITEAFVDISQNANLGSNSAGVVLTNAFLLTDDTFTSSHPIDLGGGTSGFSVAAATLTQSAPITGTGTFLVTGTGTLRLTQPATHAGDTIISSGATLQFGSGELPDAFNVTVNNPSSTWDLNGVSDTIDGLFGAGTVLLGGGTLTVGASDGDGDFSGSIQEAGTFVKTGIGVQVLSGVNTFTDSTTIDEGTLEITDNNSLGALSASLEFNDGMLRTLTTFSTGRNTTINSSGTFDVAPATTLTFTSAIGGDGELIKINDGILELTQANSYIGVTQIEAGTLRLTGAGQLADTSDVSVAAGATFDLTNLDDAVDSLTGEGDVILGTGTLTIGSDDGGGEFSGGISGTGLAGTIVKQGSGTAIFSGANAYAGGTHIDGGVLEISQDVNLGTAGGQVLFDGGTLRTTADISTVREVSLAPAGGTIDVISGTTLQAGGNIADSTNGVGALTKTGDGTLQLSGISSYTGTNILGGVVSISSNTNLGEATGQLTIDGGTLRINGIVPTNRLTSIGAGGATIDVLGGGATLIHSGTIQGNGGLDGLTKLGDGVLQFSGVNTFTAPINLNGGTLQVDLSNQLGNAANTIAFGGGTFAPQSSFANVRVMQLNEFGGTIDVPPAVTFTQSGVIEDGTSGPAGDLTKLGAGTLRLAASNTYSSGTSISGGTLQLFGAGQLPDTTNVSVASSTTLDLNNVSDAIDALSGGGDVTLGSGTLTVGANDGGDTFNGVISGTGGLVKVGTGTQSLRNKMVGMTLLPNTYTGGTAINGGTLDVESDGNLGDPAGGLSFDGGTLQVTGDTGVNSNRAVTLNSGGGTINTASQDASAMFSNVIGGTGSLRKNGPGAVTLAAANVYTGDTVVNAGILRLDGAGRIPDVSYVTVEASGTNGEGLDLNDISDAVDGLEGGGAIHLGTGTLTVGSAGSGGDFGGVIDGTGGFVKVGAGAQILAGINTYSGSTAVNGGVLEIDVNNRLGEVSGPLSFNGGTLLTTASFSMARVTTMNPGSGTFNTVPGTTLTHAAQINGLGGLRKDGAGVLALDGINSYGGATTIADGTLRLLQSERLPDTTSLTVNSPGVFDLNDNNEAINGLSGDGSVQLVDAQLTVGIAGGNGNFSGVISGSGDFQKEGAGTQTLSGQHTYSGATVVNGGELILNSGGSIDQATLSVGFNNASNGKATVDGFATTWNLTGNLNVGGGGVGQLNINNGALVTVGGQVAIGIGAGAGTVTLNGGTLDNSSGTQILVANGQLGGKGTVLGDVFNQDTVAPGTSPGVLTVSGTYVQEITGHLIAEVGGAAPGQFDQLAVSGTASLAGNLELGLAGFTPAPGDTFAILTASSLVGSFANVANGARLNISSGGTGSFQVNYGAGSPFSTNQVVLSDFIGTATFAADFDNDGDVDGDDLNAWQAAFGANSGADADGDGDSDGRDFLAWQQQFGSAASLVPTNAAIPEPTGLTVLSLVACLWTRITSVRSSSP